MSEKFDDFIAFDDPDGTTNIWNGSYVFDRLVGARVQVACSANDPRTDVREPLPVYAINQIVAKSYSGDTVLLIDMDHEGRSRSLKNHEPFLREKFNAKVVVTGPSTSLSSMTTTVAKFLVRSPIVFSLLGHHAYKVAVTKKSRQFSVRDLPFKARKFKSQIFQSIELGIGKSMSNSSSGNVGTISYDATATFIPRERMSLWEVVRMSQLFEKLLFLLVGDHCGPMTITVPQGRQQPNICEIRCASQLYANADVIKGIWRCWTLAKVDFDLGDLFDQAVAQHSKIEVALELLLDARFQADTQNRFFRLVRSLEAISRNLMPSGSEDPPPELLRIEKLVRDTADEGLETFFEKRIKGVFQKRNNIGYAIDLAKLTFPYGPVLELNKGAINRLRNLEAHAATHSFTLDETNDMYHHSLVLDFICTACLLVSLGMTREQIADGIPNGRFSWLLEASSAP